MARFAATGARLRQILYTSFYLFPEATATAERVSRPHRPHAPGNRKSTPEMLSAVRCALSQLQGEPAPPLTQAQSVEPVLELDEEVCKSTNKGKTRRVNYFTIR